MALKIDKPKLINILNKYDELGSDAYNDESFVKLVNSYKKDIATNVSQLLSGFRGDRDKLFKAISSKFSSLKKHKISYEYAFDLLFDDEVPYDYEFKLLPYLYNMDKKEHTKLSYDSAYGLYRALCEIEFDNIHQAVSSLIVDMESTKINDEATRDLSEFRHTISDNWDDLSDEIKEHFTNMGIVDDEGSLTESVTSEELSSLMSGEDLDRETGISKEAAKKVLEQYSTDGEYVLVTLPMDQISYDYSGRQFTDPKLSKLAIHQAVEDIKNGTVKPIIVADNGEVIDGNHRALAHHMENKFEIEAYVPSHTQIDKFDNLRTRLGKNGQDFSSILDQFPLNESSSGTVTLYHGTAIDPSNAFNEFKKNIGVRSSMTGHNEVEVDWTYFTDDYDLATKFANAKYEYYTDGGSSVKPVVYVVEVNLGSLNVLDLSTDEYEDVLESVGIDVISDYGIGNYYQTQMWEYLDDSSGTGKIVSSGFDGVRLLEPNQSSEYNSNSDIVHSAIGASLAIHHSKLNTVSIKDITYGGKSLNILNEGVNDLRYVFNANDLINSIQARVMGNDKYHSTLDISEHGFIYKKDRVMNSTLTIRWLYSEDGSHKPVYNTDTKVITIPFIIDDGFDGSNQSIIHIINETRDTLIHELRHWYDDIIYDTNEHSYTKMSELENDSLIAINKLTDSVAELTDIQYINKTTEVNAVIVEFINNTLESYIGFRIDDDFSTFIKPLFDQIDKTHYTQDSLKRIYKRLYVFYSGLTSLGNINLSNDFKHELINKIKSNTSINESIEYIHKDIIDKKDVIYFEANYAFDDNYKEWFDSKYVNSSGKCKVVHLSESVDKVNSMRDIYHKESTYVNDWIEPLTESFNDDAGMDLLKPKGESVNIGEETGDVNSDGFSFYKNPYGSYRSTYSKGGEILGAIQVMSTDGGKTGVIANVYVHPEHRRGGLASELHTFTKSKFKHVVHSDSLSTDGFNWKNSLNEAVDSADTVWFHHSNTSGIEELRPSDDGYLGEGVYLTSEMFNPEHGKYTYVVKANYTNPIIIDETTSESHEASVKVANDRIKEIAAERDYSTKYRIDFNKYTLSDMHSGELSEFFDFDSMLRILESGEKHLCIFDSKDVEIVDTFNKYGNSDDQEVVNKYLTESIDISMTDGLISYLTSIGKTEDDLGWLGSGEFGNAYTIGDDKVLKVTSSKTEFAIAKELMENNYSSFADVYDVREIDGQYIIILEELEIDSDTETLWYEMEEILSSQGLDASYVGNIDLDEWREMGNEVSDELEQFINDVYGISHDYRRLGIEAPDMQPDNMGKSSDGTYKAFDIEDKSGRYAPLVESESDFNKYEYVNSKFDSYIDRIVDYYLRVMKLEDMDKAEPYALDTGRYPAKYSDLNNMPVFFLPTVGTEAKFRRNSRGERSIIIPLHEVVHYIMEQFQKEYMELLHEVDPDVDKDTGFWLINYPDKMRQYKIDEEELLPKYLKLVMKHREQIVKYVNEDVRDTFTHEMTHAIDDVKGLFPNASLRAEMTETEYYNSQEELNAYLIGMLSRINLDQPIKEIFKHTIISAFLNKMQPKNRKKIIKRIYDTIQRLREKEKLNESLYVISNGSLFESYDVYDNPGDALSDLEDGNSIFKYIDGTYKKVY